MPSEMSVDRFSGSDGPDEDEPPQLSEKFLAGMALAQTPQQQEIAGQIYRRLAAGDDVEDVKGLIEEMMRVVVRQRGGERAEAGRTGSHDTEDGKPWWNRDAEDDE
jgi:hypothetical protein